MANCPDCGGMMRFNIREQKLECQYCSGLFDPYKIDRINHTEIEEDEFGMHIFTCPQCGGELMSSDYDLSGNCSFCGSPVVFDKKMRNEKMPKWIIPFQLTKEDCKAKYMEVLNQCRFAPKELKDPSHIEGFRGIYVPYWMYTVHMEGEPFHAKGKRSYTKGDYDYTDTYDLQGQNKAVYEEISHDSSSILQDDISEQIEPFHFREKKKSNLKPFTPSYFAGFYAEPADVEPEVYYHYAKDVAETRSRKYLDEKSQFAQYKISGQLEQKHFASRVTDAKLALMPIWFLSYRKKNRVAYAALNGQTGKMVSDLPIDMKIFVKYLVIVAAVVFAGLNLFTILPKTVTLISIMISFLVAKVCYDDVRLVAQRARDQDAGKKRNETVNSDGTQVLFAGMLLVALFCKLLMFIDDDMTVLSSNFVYTGIGIITCFVQLMYLISTIRQWKSLAKAKYYVGLLPILCFAASCYGTAVLHARPVQDAYYYTAALIVIAITLVTFITIILNYNKVATRALPQFKIHTGGDDHD